MPDDLCQLVKPDDQAQHETDKQAPRRGALPLVEAISDPAQQDDGANQRVTRTGGWSRPSYVVLERLCRALERTARLIFSHGAATFLNPCPRGLTHSQPRRKAVPAISISSLCEKLHQPSYPAAVRPESESDQHDQVQYFQ